MANNTIKGLNIKISGDTQEFDKDITQVNKELKTSAQLGNSLNKALKVDPTSIDLLNKSLENNEKQLQLATAKAKGLEQEYDRLSKLNLNDLVSEQKQLEAQLQNSTDDTKELERQLKMLDDSTGIDTSEYKELDKQLEQSKQESASLEKELEGVNQDIKALDPSEMQKLDKEVINSQTQVKKLDQEQNRLNQDIKALDTEEYDKLSNSTKRAAVNTGELTKEQVGFSSSSDKASNSAKGESKTLLSAAKETDAFGKATSLATKFLNPYTAALGAASTALISYGKEAQKDKEVQMDLASSFYKSSQSTQKNTNDIEELASAYSLDLGESQEIVIGAQKTFNKQLEQGMSRSDAYTSALLIQKSGLIDLEEATNAMNYSYQNFDTSADEAYDSLSEQLVIMATYGQAADDIIDTQKEWGDTFQTLGYDQEQFNESLVLGLDTGARSTDEFANAINELTLRMNDNNTATKQAVQQLNDYGLSYSELQKELNSGDPQQVTNAILDIYNALSDLYEETGNVTSQAAGLFGTYGEEYVATFVDDSKAVDQLTNAVHLLEFEQNASTSITKAMTDELSKNYKALGLTSSQANILTQELKDQGVGGFLAAEGLDGMTLANKSLLDAEILTQKQSDLLQKTIDNTSTSTDHLSFAFLQSANNTGLLNNSLDTLVQKDIITKEQQDSLNKSIQTASSMQDVYKSTLASTDNQLAAFGQALLVGTGSQKEWNKETENAVDPINALAIHLTNAAGIEDEYTKKVDKGRIAIQQDSTATAENQKALQKLESEHKIARGTTEDLTQAMQKYTQSDKTASDKVNYLSQVTKDLSGSELDQDGKVTHLNKTLGTLSDVLSGNINKYYSDAKATQKSSSTLTENTKAAENSRTVQQKLAGNLQSSRDAFHGMGKSAEDSSKDIDDNTDSALRWDRTPLDDKESHVTFFGHAEDDKGNSKSKSKSSNTYSALSDENLNSYQFPSDSLYGAPISTPPVASAPTNNITPQNLVPSQIVIGDINVTVDGSNLDPDQLAKEIVKPLRYELGKLT